MFHCGRKGGKDEGRGMKEQKDKKEREYFFDLCPQKDNVEVIFTDTNTNQRAFIGQYGLCRCNQFKMTLIFLPGNFHGQKEPGGLHIVHGATMSLT